MAENAAKEGFKGVVQNTPFYCLCKSKYSIYIVESAIFIE